MAVYNVHSRVLPGADANEAGALLDGLATDHDRLWPGDTWPPVRFDRPLSVGADGGHGPIRYRVEGYAPRQWVLLRFTGPRGVDGFHEFAVLPRPDGVELRHTLVIHTRGPARLSWPFVIRWLHDALLEDLLDRAEREVTGTVRRPARWSWYVRILRGLARGRRPHVVPDLVHSDV